MYKLYLSVNANLRHRHYARCTVSGDDRRDTCGSQTGARGIPREYIPWHLRAHGHH